jgi:hypothetical protein
MKIENLCFRAVCCASDGTGVRSGVAPDTCCPCSVGDAVLRKDDCASAAITSAITATATARIAMLSRIVSIHTRDPAPSLQTCEVWVWVVRLLECRGCCARAAVARTFATLKSSQVIFVTSTIGASCALAFPWSDLSLKRNVPAPQAPLRAAKQSGKKSNSSRCARLQLFQSTSGQNTRHFFSSNFMQLDQLRNSTRNQPTSQQTPPPSLQSIYTHSSMVSSSTNSTLHTRCFGDCTLICSRWGFVNLPQ